MRSRMLLTSLALLAAPVASAQTSQASVPILAVFDVENRGASLDRDMLGRLGDYLAARLTASGVFQVIPREQVKSRLVEQKKASYKSCYAESCQIELGRELSAQKSLSTVVLKLGSACVVTSTLYDLVRSTAERAATAEGPCTDDGVKKSLDGVVAQLTGIATAPRPAPQPAPQPAPEPRPQPTPPRPAPEPVAEPERPVRPAGGFHCPPRGRSECQARCDARDADACARLGWMALLGDGIPDDAGRAVSLLGRACDRGSADGCAGLGQATLTGRGVSRDEPAAVALLEKACDRGSGLACDDLATRAQARKDRRAESLFKKAVPLLTRACDAGEAASCLALARDHREGLGTPESPDRAAALYRSLCDQGYGRACAQLGTLHCEGSGVAKDLSRCESLMDSGCDAGSAMACRRLGQLLASGRTARDGQAGRREQGRAASLFRRACEAGDALGCRALGRAHEGGVGVPQDVRKADDAYRRACELGDRESCRKGP